MLVKVIEQNDKHKEENYLVSFPTLNPIKPEPPEDKVFE